MYQSINHQLKVTILSFFMLLCTPSLLSGQGSIGIGTASPNTNAMLDVVSTDKGLLIPRVGLTSTTSPLPLGGFVAGMMVYNTAIAGVAPNNVTPGFYTSNGVRWERTSGGWNLSGNAGTSSVTNFIGTTDNQDVVFRRNNS
ncbi:MAG TPA: hypothetical protein PLY70_04960, partial [Saprospiraceae bacterium]|nr:hypothetical protein [Saprospiraceae bacterium]